MTTLELTQQHLPSTMGSRSKGFLSGAAAALVSQLFYVPVDVVSERQMWHGSGSAHRSHPARGQSGFAPSVQARRFHACEVGSYTNGAKSIHSPSMVQVVKDIGVRGLYRGYSVSVMTYMPYDGIWWMTYGGLTNQFHIQPDNMLKQAGAGAVAGCIAATLTNPLDVVRTRVQVCLAPDTITRTFQY